MVSHSASSSQTDFSSMKVHIPRYRLSQLPMTTYSSGSVTMAPTSGLRIEFKIPALTVVNLARTVLQFNYDLPASAVAGQITVANLQAFEFSNIYFGKASGDNAVQLEGANYYVSAIRPYRTKTTALLTSDPLEGFFPSNQLGAQNLRPFGNDQRSDQAAGCASTVPYNEFQYLLVAGADQQAITITKSFPLSQIKDTIFERDLDMVFPVDMYLRMNVAPLQQLGWYTTAPANPGRVAEYTAITANSTLNNCFLYVAAEQNMNIVEKLLSDLAGSRISIQIPYTFQYSWNTPAASSTTSFSFTMSKGFGKYVKRIMWVPFSGNQYSPIALSHPNIQGNSISQFTTSLNARPLQDRLINCYNPYMALPAWATAGQQQQAEDYREMSKFIKDSALLNYSVYAANWAWFDSWGTPFAGTADSYAYNKISDGYPLTNGGDLVWSCNGNTPSIAVGTNMNNANGLYNCLFVTFLRDLKITATDVILE